MTIFIIAFAALILLAGIAIVVNPDSIFGRLEKHTGRTGLHVAAVVARLLLGALLISQADVSEYPFAIELIGWLSIAAAVILAVIGRDRFKRVMSWALSLKKPLGRVAGVLAVCFGVFLVYAFI